MDKDGDALADQVSGPRGRCRTRWLVAASLGSLSLAALATSPVAEAAFPGRNGGIVFHDDLGRVVGVPPGERRARVLAPPLPDTPDFGAAFDGIRLSPGGRLLAFRAASATETNPSEIWIQTLGRRGRLRRLRPKATLLPALKGSTFDGPSHIFGDSEADWSPDGQSIVFSHTERLPSGEPADPMLYIYHRGRVRPLTPGTEPTWSVRGEIALSRAFFKPGFVRDGLYVIRADGSELRRLANTYKGAAPDWSPRGHRLVFTTHNDHLATISRGGDRLRRLTGRRDCADEDPTFSPGGGQVAFWRRDSGIVCRPGLFVVQTNGRRLRQLRRGADDIYCCDLDWQTVRRRRSW